VFHYLIVIFFICKCDWKNWMIVQDKTDAAVEDAMGIGKAQG